MTAIAYRNGVLAAGNASTTCGIYKRCIKTDKFYSKRHGMGMMVALTGYVAFLEQCKVAMKNDGPWPEITRYDKDTDLSHQIGIVVTENMTVHYLYADGNLGAEMDFGGWYCDGSAYEFLAGALAAGAGAYDAILLANEFTTSDSMGVSFLVWSEVFGTDEGGIPF